MNTCSRFSSVITAQQFDLGTLHSLPVQPSSKLPPRLPLHSGSLGMRLKWCMTGRMVASLVPRPCGRKEIAFSPPTWSGNQTRSQLVYPMTVMITQREEVPTCKVSVSTAGLPALLDAISSHEPSQGLAGTRYGMDLPAQLCLQEEVIPNINRDIHAVSQWHELCGKAEPQ